MFFIIDSLLGNIFSSNILDEGITQGKALISKGAFFRRLK